MFISNELIRRKKLLHILDELAQSNRLFFCKIERCGMRNFPYHSSDNAAIITADKINSLVIDPSNNTSRDPNGSHLNCPLNKSFFHDIPFPISRTVYFDQFLDIQCDYINPRK